LAIEILQEKKQSLEFQVGTIGRKRLSGSEELWIARRSGATPDTILLEIGPSEMNPEVNPDFKNIS